MKSKTAKETLSITTKVVLPNDTNTLGNLFGGQLLAWMDVISSVAAQRHCKRVVVTASVNNVSFKMDICYGFLGDQIKNKKEKLLSIE